MDGRNSAGHFGPSWGAGRWGGGLAAGNYPTGGVFYYCAHPLVLAFWEGPGADFTHDSLPRNEGARPIRPLALYLVGTGSWFTAFGLQSVLFAWLVTMELREPPQNIGVAQMCLLIPATLFMLVGGSVADRFGPRRMSVLAQAAALLPVAWLLWVLLSDRLSFTNILLFAVGIGTVQAFVTPARDALLNQVAGTELQRTVMLTSMVQFATQTIGFAVAIFADRFGAQILVGAQLVTLLIGVVALWAIRVEDEAPVSGAGVEHNLLRSLREGASSVLRSPTMRSIVILNVAMGMFFMGAYIVGAPVLIREFYSTTSRAIALVNIANSTGLVIMIMALLRFGTVHKPGLGLLASQFCGALVLACCIFPVSYAVFLGIIFLWGLCGGVAMSLSRAIMQEQAPPGQRGRIMSFYSFAMMGAGALGAPLSGYLCELLGPRQAFLISAMLMLLVVVGVFLTGNLGRLRQTAA